MIIMPFHHKTASQKTSSAVVTEIINCTQSVLSLHDSEISAKEIKNTKFILPTESIQKRKHRISRLPKRNITIASCLNRLWN